MRHHRSAIALVTLLVAAASAPSAQAASSTSKKVTYEASAANIANPERGFYKHTETHYRADGSGYTPLSATALADYRAQGITQILRVFYLEKFASSDQLDAAYLKLVRADLETARSAGISVITRFAYAQPTTDWPYEPPYNDAPLERVLAHIKQLKPIFHEFADVIPVVQQGFIGLWGENYYTDHFVADPSDPGTVTEADWKKRSAVVQGLLDAVPTKRMVQVRTMLMKQKFARTESGSGSATPVKQAWSGSDNARIGHHNDCFLAPFGDYGTFLSDPITLDEEYLAADTRFVPMGGETCEVNKPRTDWAGASAEMARYHYSYLNRDYNTQVLDSWGAEGLAEAQRRLGYRFVLTSSKVTTTGKTAKVAVSLRNEGWASPYNYRRAQLVLKNKKTTRTVKFTGQDDVRRWAAGSSVNLSSTVKGLPRGTYSVYLSIPSADAQTRSDPKFAVRTANRGTWDAKSGLNNLRQTITVK